MEPLNTQTTDDGIVCIRDKDFNCFLVKTSSGYIAIDSGYHNSANTRKAMSELEITPESVQAVFLTHLDIDHAGGMNAGTDVLFPRATVYLGGRTSRLSTLSGIPSDIRRAS